MLNLYPNQIITLNDYPLYSEQVLKLYHRMFWKGQGRIVPPCPVIHKSTGSLFMSGRGKEAEKYNKLLVKFFKEHPQAEYFMVDGSHKTTAAALCGQRISAMVFKTDKDIQEARKLVVKGEIISLTAGGKTIRAALQTLRKHFYASMFFETVAEKAARMVKDKKVPRYMREIYKKVVYFF